MDNYVEVLQDGSHTFRYEYDPIYSIRDYMERDIEFLIIQMLLEAYENGKTTISMGNIVNMNYWHTDEITSEVYEHYDDHWAIETLLLDTLLFIVEDLRLGRIDEIALTHYSKAMDRIAENAVIAGQRLDQSSIESDVREMGMKYAAMINALLLLNPRYLESKQNVFDNADRENLRSRMEAAERIEEKIEDFERSPLTDLVIDVPELIEVDFTMNSQQVDKIKTEIQSEMNAFKEDEPSGVQIYDTNRKPNFTKQLENFAKYLTSLTLVDNKLNIPFTALRNNDFDAVKMMTFLKQKGTLNFEWNQKSHWRASVLTPNITVDSLLDKTPSQDKSSIYSHNGSLKTKYNLSFSKQPCALTFTDEDGLEKKISIQGQVQKEVLRVIFRDMEQAFDEWSLHEISEILGEDDVNVRAVKNAIYQFNRKVQSRIPHIKRLFDYNNNSAKLDEKYVSQS